MMLKLATTSSQIKGVLSFCLLAFLLSFFNNTALGQAFGDASEFNLFSRDKALLRNSDVEGSAAIGGGSEVTGGYDFGKFWTNDNTNSNFSLVVNGTIKTTGVVKLDYGSAIHSGALTGAGLEIAHPDPNAGAFPINYINTYNYLVKISDAWAALPTNGTASSISSAGVLTLTGTNPSLNIFKFPNGFSATVFRLNINIPKGSSVLINYGGATPSIFNINTYFNSSSPLPGADGSRSVRKASSDILWNFYSATSLTMSNTAFKGTILAPDAVFKAENGHVDGQVFVKSMVAQNGTSASDLQINWFPYTGDTPCPPMSVNATGGTLTCTVKSITARSTVSPAGGTYSWTGTGIVSGGTTATPVLNKVGNYTLTYTYNGCKVSDVITVTKDAAQPDAGPNTSICEPATTYNVKDATAGTFWSAAPGNPSAATITPTSGVINGMVRAGTYKFILKDASSSCQDIIEIVKKDLPNVNATGGVLTCTVASIIAKSTVSPAGGTYSWTGTAAVYSGATTPTPRLNKVGTYTLKYTYNGCSASDATTVTKDAAQPDAGPNASICEPATTYNVKDATAGTFWAAAPGNPSAATITPTSGVINGMVKAGTYKFILKDASSSCQDIIEIVKRDLPDVDATGGVLTCTVKSVTARSTVTPAGGTYSWSGTGVVSGGTTRSPSLNKVGNYTLTYTYNGCKASDVATVTADLGTPDAGPNASICEPAVSYNLKDAPAGTSWSAAPGNPSAATITPTSGVVSGMVKVGIYKFILKDASSACQDIVEIEKKALPIISGLTGGIITCANKTVGIVATSTVRPAGGTYSWSGPGIVSGGTTGTPKLNKVGNYTLTYNFDGCSTSKTVAVTTDVGTPDAGPNASICEPAVTYNFKDAPVGTSWSAAPGNPSAATITPTSGVVSGLVKAGIYKFILKDASSACQDIVEIEKKALPIISGLTGGVITCANNTIGIVATSTVRPAGGTYSWSGPGIVSGGTTGTPKLNKVGNYILTYNFDGCSTSKTVAVTNDLGTPDAGSNASICEPATTYNFKDAPVGTSWLAAPGNPSPVTINPTSGVVSGLVKVGIYKFILKDASSACQDIVEIEKKALPIISGLTGGIITCANKTVGIVATSIVRPAGGTYSWSGPGIVSGGTTGTPKLNKVGTYTLTYTFDGCSTSKTVVVTNDVGTPDAGSNASICVPTTTYALKVAPVGTTWSVATGNPSLAIINASTGAVSGMANIGTYKFILTDASSACKDTVEIVKKALPTVQANGGVIICTPDRAINAGSTVRPAGGTYSWSGPGIVSGGTTGTPKLNKAGIYTLTYTYDGCSASDTAVVRTDVGTPDAGSNVSICVPTTTYALKVAPVGTTWSVATGNPSAAIINASTGAVIGITNVGTYKFILTDVSSACKDTVEIVKKALPTVQANGGVIICTPDRAINAGSTVRPAGGTYSWSGPGIVSGGTTGTPKLNKAGIYTLTYTYDGCSASDTAVVRTDVGTPDAGSNVSICVPTTTYALKAAPVGTTWSVATGNPSAAIINASTGAVTGIANVGTYKFILTDISSSCKDTVEIVKKALPTVRADGGLLTCGVDGITPQIFVLPAGGTYSWTGPGILSGGTTGTPRLNKPGIYTLTYTYNGCSASDTAVVRNDLLKPDAGANASICVPTTTYALKVAPVGTTWSVATGNPSAAIINASTGAVTGIANVGTYKFILTDVSSSCKDTVEIVKNALPTVRADGGTLTCGNQNGGFIPQSGVSPAGGTYSWAGPGIVSGGTTGTPTLNRPGIYTLTYTGQPH